MSADEIKAIIPVFQTILWIALILYLLWYFRKEVEIIRGVLSQRMESGSSIEIGPIKLGERLERLENSLEETKENVEGLLEHQRAMEAEFLKLSDEYRPSGTLKEIDALGRRLKSHARGLGNLSFLKELCQEGVEERHFYAIGCAIQERPQYDFVPLFIHMLEWISKDKKLQGFRLRVMYKCIQSLDNLLRLDNKRETQFISQTDRNRLGGVLSILSENQRVKADDDSSGNRGIGVFIQKVKENTGCHIT